MPESGTSGDLLDATLRHGDRIRSLHEIVFALNIACALAYGFMSYLAQLGERPPNSLRYYFSRSALKLSDLLHGSLTSSVPGGVALRGLPSLTIVAGQQLLILISVFAITALLLLLVRLMAGKVVYRVLVNRCAIAVTLLALPSCRLLLLWLARSRTEMGLEGPGVSVDPLIPIVVFLAEVLCLAILSIVNQKYSLPIWILGVLLLLHYAFWLAALWPFAPIYVVIRNFGYYSLFLIFLASGYTWLSYLKWTRQHHDLVRQAQRPGAYAFITASGAVAVSLLLWFPRPGLSFSHPKDLSTIKIKMERTTCFGMCPNYSLTVHGDGLVEYSGHSYVLDHGSRTGTVSRQQVLDLLQELDRIHFGSLEDRAFDWCFDTPTVIVSVSIDGKSKRVNSDESCTGARLGLQDQFVTFTEQIDTVTDSRHWWHCDHYCQH